jgi:AraC-like DNA-binding protein
MPVYRDYKISYLAEECGYGSPQVFAIAFKGKLALHRLIL